MKNSCPFTVIYVAPQAKRVYDIINIVFMKNYGLKINICYRNPFRRISARETTCCSSRNDVSLSNPKISSHNVMFHV